MRVAVLIALLVLLHLSCTSQVIMGKSRDMVRDVALEKKVKLQTSCETLIARDVLDLTQSYWENGYDFQTSDSLTASYVSGIIQELRRTPGWQEKTFSEKDFKAAKANVFKKIIQVGFVSDPAGATVKIKTPLTDIGKTSTSKPLESDKAYTFTFELNGYHIKDTTYTVTGYPSRQDVLVKLKKK